MAAEASVYRASDQSIVVDTLTVLDFDTETFDVGTMHDPVTNPSRLTVPAGETGYYVVVAQVAWGNGAGTKGFWAYLRKNGTVVARDFIEGNVTAGNLFNRLVALLSLVPTDYVDVQIYQTGGTASAWTCVGGLSYTFLQAIKVA